MFSLGFLNKIQYLITGCANNLLGCEHPFDDDDDDDDEVGWRRIIFCLICLTASVSRVTKWLRW